MRHQDDHSISKISELLVLNLRTVSKFLAMSEQEYEEFLNKQNNREKKLLPFEDFVRQRLEEFRNNPAALIHKLS